MRKVRNVGIVLLAMLVLLQQSPAVYATEAEKSDAQKQLEQQQQQINEEKEKNKQQQNALENEKQGAQNKAKGLKDEANQLGSTYNKLNSQLQNVTDEISKTQNDIAATTSDIEQLEKDLEKAKKAQKEQYDGMKKRIQYMYENGTDSILVSILSSGSVSEFVQRAEYASMIATYDRDMVQSYEELQSTILAKSEELSAKRKQLLAYEDNLSSKQDELDDLVDNAGNAYAAKKGEANAAQMTVDEFNDRIAQFRAQEKELEQQYAAIQVELAKQIAAEQGDSIEDTTGAIGYSEADLKLMAAIIQAEADGEPYEGKLAVGSVIMNRVMSSSFPNSLSEVIYQKNQFQPVRDGHLALILERGPNDTCIQAARQVLGGYRSGNWLFFMTKKWADYYGITGYSMIGNHAFFLRWGAN